MEKETTIKTIEFLPPLNLKVGETYMIFFDESGDFFSIDHKGKLLWERDKNETSHQTTLQ